MCGRYPGVRIRRVAADVRARFDRLDVLINNAGGRRPTGTTADRRDLESMI
jgi:NAD(P)-dependent dehydrogenase (short-subunit alcohol dehydrogenase family)